MNLNNTELLNVSKQLLHMSKSLESSLNLKNVSEKELFNYLIDKEFDENKIIFFHNKNKNFEGNVKALYNYMIKNNMNEKYKIIWVVTNTDKFANHKIKNVEFINLYFDGQGGKESLIVKYHFLTSKYVFMDDYIKDFFDWGYYSYPARKTKVINIWHGIVGFKQIPDALKRDSGFFKFDMVLCTSMKHKEATIKTFDCNENLLFELGYPQNDLLFENNNAIKKLLYAKGIKQKFNKYIICMPTFRKNSFTRSDLAEYKDYNEYIIPVIFSEYELLELNKSLNEKNILIIVKPHPVAYVGNEFPKDLSNITYVNNDFLNNNDIELYNLVSETDALLTDYSSIAFDYLLLNKPIGYTIPDHEEYPKITGFIEDNYLDYMVGDKIFDLEELEKFIINLVQGNDYYKNERIKLCNHTHKYQDNKNCERFLQYFNIIV